MARKLYGKKCLKANKGILLFAFTILISIEVKELILLQA